MDIRRTREMVRRVDGLLGLILFAAVNDMLGGVFLALMDAYGLSLVSVESWGLLWGVLSFGFIIGMIVWLTLIPVIEAAEQTAMQRVVPFD